MAKVAVAEGRKRAAAGDLAGAVRLLEPATKLAGPDLRPQAEALLRGWQVELAALARAEAEQASLNVLREYLQNDKMLLEAWYGLQQFEEQFPDSEYLTRFPAIRQGLRPRVDAAVARAFALLDDYQTRSNWPAYRYVAEKIASAPLSADSQQRFALVQDQIQRLTVEADRRFSATLDLRRGYLGNESSIVKLLQELPLILRLNPDHREAEQFLEKVRAQAQKRAQALLLSARSKMRLTNKGLARRELLRVTRLDPGGDLGKKAAELLRQIDAQEAQ